MKKILLSLLMLNLIGCAFGAGTDDQQREEIERKEELRSIYAPVVGTYEGTITVSGRTAPMRLYVYTVDVESGKNQLGEPQLTPVLFAKFRRMDGFESDRILKARYVPSTGEFTAVTGQQQGSGGNGGSGDSRSSADANFFNVRGRLSGLSLEGEIVKTSGFYGTYSLTKITGPQSGPNEGDEQEYREHIRRELKKVTGIYHGNAYAGSDQSTVLYPMQVEILAREVYQGDTWTVSLYAIWFRTDAHPSVTRQVMRVSYDPTVTPASINMLAEGSGGNSTFVLNIIGTVENGVISANIYGSAPGITTLRRQ